LLDLPSSIIAEAPNDITAANSKKPKLNNKKAVINEVEVKWVPDSSSLADLIFEAKKLVNPFLVLHRQ